MTTTETITYNVKIAEFDGPFDLILFFIERDEIDIYDIPIHKLCDDFLEYIQNMQDMDINLGAEFILVAATLMRIKAKTLLPRKELNELGEEIDPRADFVEKLLEYKRYKDILGELHDLAQVRSQQHTKGANPEELKQISEEFSTEMEMESLNLFKILKVFSKVVEKMENRKNAPRHKVVRHPYTVEEQMEILQLVLASGEWIHFEKVFESCREKMEAIFRFMSMLDLVQLLKVELRLGDGINNCWIRFNDKLEEQFIEAERVLAEKEGRLPNEYVKKEKGEENGEDKEKTEDENEPKDEIENKENEVEDGPKNEIENDDEEE